MASTKNGQLCDPLPPLSTKMNNRYIAYKKELETSDKFYNPSTPSVWAS